MSQLWTAAEIRAAIQGEMADGSWTASGVAIDSRTLVAGDLFIAIRGPKHDGHAFVADAFAKGAVAAIVDHPIAGAMPTLVVPDTLAALRALAAAARRRTGARIAAITGSVGKTSTKEALGAALARHRPTHASVGSFNNQWGVPLSLSRMPRDSGYGVFELGMNHAGEIVPLTRLARPHLAIVTTVEAVHLEFFASVRDIAEAKAEIFDGLEAGGIAVLNRDNAYFDLLRERALARGAARVIGFGESRAADVRLIRAVAHPDCTCISADIDGQAMTYKVGAPGRPWVINSLAVLAAVKAIGADLGLAGLALATLVPPAGRGSRHVVELPSGPLLVIDESYNASPASMRAALATLGTAPVARGGRRIAVLGDMLELGTDSAGFHRDLAAAVEASGIDLVFCCGPDMRTLADALPASRRAAHAATSEMLLRDVVEAVRAGDAVMVKGSLGSRMAPIVAALRGLGEAAPRRANGG
jgi:UDP-N-acetylmuramoyl-tripeptide--D-alanyl-D-alanine ligase